MAFQQGLSGLSSSSQALDVISHNVANANTTGYKASQTVFADVYSSTLGADPYKQVGSGSRVAAIRQNFSQGSITETGNSLDMAINGDGFFMVKRPVLGDNQMYYTRAGEFQLDKDGYVITATGYQLLGYPGMAGAGDAVPIRVPYDTGTPKETSSVTMTLNLDANRPVIPAPFNANDSSTYNFQTTVLVYDSLGIAHNLDLFFKKTEKISTDPDNTVASWDVYGRMSGSDLDTTKPVARLNFDASGRLIAAGGVSSTAFSLPPAKYTTTATPSSLPPTTAGEKLTIKSDKTDADGLDIVIDDAESAKDIADLVNDQSGLTGVSANAKTEATLTYFTITAAGTITINDTPIDVPANSNVEAVRDLINESVIGVTATVGSDGTSLILVAEDGSNIAVAVDGTGVQASYGETPLTTTATTIYGQVTFESSDPFTITIADDATSFETIDPPVRTVDPITLANGATIGGVGDGIIDITLNATQFALPSSVNTISQDGVPAGELAGVSVTKEGQVQARYTNGNVDTVGTVAIAAFRNPNGLVSMGDNLWVSSLESGPGVAGTPGAGTRGFISGGAVEASNVDLTAELVNMIVQQRAYQANAQSIKTQDQILQTIINLR